MWYLMQRGVAFHPRTRSNNGAAARQARLLLTFTSVCSQHHLRHCATKIIATLSKPATEYREASHFNSDHRSFTPRTPTLETSKSPSAARSEQSIVFSYLHIWRSKRRTSAPYHYLIVSRTRWVMLNLRTLDIWLKDNRIGKCERKATKMLQKHSREPRTNHIRLSNLSYSTLDYGEGLFWTQM